MTSLNGKIALVTGSSRGIGRAIAIRLAREGAKVVLTGRDLEKLHQTAAEIREDGGEAAIHAVDLRAPTAATELAQFAQETYGGLDILVNNAGATKRGDFLTLTDADFEDGFALKYYGAVRLTRAAWPSLQATSGAVLNIIGVGGRTPGAEFTIGGSVNAALLSFTKAIADLGVQDGVQVNAINPGRVHTDRLTNSLPAPGPARESALAQLVQKSSITRIGEPEEVAALAAFILGPEGRWLQGSLIDIDGGQTKSI
ncbi:short-chain dehydrogenase/reductase [Capsulimonas corticalis]|uniref:Short-chain dehydrogenase/reductase n=1 Tax=Capsulimonas corticalis TaxID=2219043 RepID=A0A402CU66_9BACT|nr:SDR family oxidoreductase [Capsulimonas corticalis]BDI28865.1 short-chain dehydrogenase/reductase [Capsulimonas corticalis]